MKCTSGGLLHHFGTLVSSPGFDNLGFGKCSSEEVVASYQVHSGATAMDTGMG